MQLRVIGGFLISALALPAYIAALGGNLNSAAAIGAMTSFITLIAGVPIYFVARTRHWLSLGHCLLGGAVAAQVVMLPFVSFAFEDGLPPLEALMDLVLPAFWFGVCGAIHGGLFWLVALCGNAEARAVRPVVNEERK